MLLKLLISILLDLLAATLMDYALASHPVAEQMLMKPLLFFTLLLLISSCFKKQKEAPTASNSYPLNGSYKLNGELVKCSVMEQTYLASEGDQTFEVIELWFVTVPQPANGEESITLFFRKPDGQPTFTLADISVDHCRYSQVNGRSLHQRTSTATETGTGDGFSGIFSGTASVAHGTSAQQDFHFTDGVFTYIRP